MEKKYENSLFTFSKLWADHAMSDCHCNGALNSGRYGAISDPFLSLFGVFNEYLTSYSHLFPTMFNIFNVFSSNMSVLKQKLN